MMKYIDGVSRYVNPLVYQYIITASRLHSENIVARQFSYSFNVLIRYNNHRHLTASNILFISITNSSIFSFVIFILLPDQVLYVFNFGSIPIISYPNPGCHILPFTATPFHKSLGYCLI